MQVSARILGQEYGLTAEEMNRVLFKLGYLEGTPGNYGFTEKALPYASEKDFHRGTGGYACYNRYWSTKTFDDSIKEVLVISPELKKEVRDEIIDIRTARYATQAAARAKADAEFIAKREAEKTAREAAERAALDREEIVAKWKNVGKVGLIIGGVLIVGYGIYTITPKIKEWWREHNHDTQELEDNKLYK